MMTIRTARRVLVKVVTAIAVLIAAASVTFFAQLLVPGDRATAILNQQNGRAQQWTAAQLAPVNHKFGFDHPLIVQYADYVGGLFRGNLGTSYTQYKPVTQVIGAELMPSLVLTVVALTWSLTPGDTWVDGTRMLAYLAVLFCAMVADAQLKTAAPMDRRLARRNLRTAMITAIIGLLMFALTFVAAAAYVA